MKLTESYKKRLQELAGIDVSNFESFSRQDYEAQLRRLGIDKFEDLVGRTVYYIKPVYGYHKVLKWFPDRGEYLLFTDGNRVLANPFRVMLVPEKTEKETDSELKWVLTKLCEDKVKEIDIEGYEVNQDAELTVVFDVLVEVTNPIVDPSNINMDDKVEVLYSGVVLKLWIDDNRGLKSYLVKDGFEKVISGDIKGKWSDHSPFIAPNYSTTKEDWGYMKKIVERIILENI